MEQKKSGMHDCWSVRCLHLTFESKRFVAFVCLRLVARLDVCAHCYQHTDRKKGKMNPNDETQTDSVKRKAKKI